MHDPSRRCLGCYRGGCQHEGGHVHCLMQSIESAHAICCAGFDGQGNRRKASGTRDFLQVLMLRCCNRECQADKDVRDGKAAAQDGIRKQCGIMASVETLKLCRRGILPGRGQVETRRGGRESKGRPDKLFG